MKIMVIGGHGTLGRPVVRRLVQDGYDVRVLARSPEKARPLLPASTEIVGGDLSNLPSLESALEGCGAVYLSVDTPPKAAFHSETQGLLNLIQAARPHGSPRLLLLSALGSSWPEAISHPWWHLREKAEAQKIAQASGLPWTIFEPTWFLESIPLFIHKKNFVTFSGPALKAHWMSGDDYGRMISAAITKGIGQEEIVPVQGRELLTMGEAGTRFIQAYDPTIRVKKVPWALLRLAGLFNAQANELVQLFKLSASHEEPTPNPAIWERYAQPLITPATYADYVRSTGDFPQKT